MTLPDFFESDRAAVEAALDQILPPDSTHPESIHRAMRYSIRAGGKRVRPLLCIETARLFSHDLEGAIRVGSAIECIHTYSLIHDDLPALDNDDLRRGKPTSHKVFGEAIAILAGDALLTLAFQTLATAPLEPARGVRVIAEIAAAAGTVDGMVGGQVADVEAGGKPVDQPTIEYIHRSKTAALIRGWIVASAIAGGAATDDVERLRRFGDYIGWAFQVVDDLLDVEESSAKLGKTAGKDRAQAKATYPAFYGIERSRTIAADLERRALAELAFFGERAACLRQLAEFLVARRS